jgi:hypothetical protein
VNKSKESRISRYRNSPREEGYILEDDEMLYPNPDDTTVIVRPSEEGRLDKVATRVYKNPLLAWVLARRNGILNPLEVKPGTIIYCPTIQRIYSKGGPLGL